MKARDFDTDKPLWTGFMPYGDSPYRISHPKPAPAATKRTSLMRSTLSTFVPKLAVLGVVLLGLLDVIAVSVATRELVQFFHLIR